ncbi:MAG: hypothetical protein ABI177_04120 [Edaphobacter sp.]
MNEPGTSTTGSQHQPQNSTLVATKGHKSPISIDFRVMELEIENLRLQRLVAELLLKNQKLREDEEPGMSFE